MSLGEFLRASTELANKELQTALEGVDSELAWARVLPSSNEYLHTDGTIQGIVLHLAGCKVMYASLMFGGNLRWRDVADEIEAVEGTWEGSLDYLRRAELTLRAAWENLSDEQLSADVPTHWQAPWPAWRAIERMNQHDVYHAGQIAVIRFAATPSSTPPESVAEDLRLHTKHLPHH